MIITKIATKRQIKAAARMIAVLLAALVSVNFASLQYGFAADAAVGTPIRESHRIKVGEKRYCAFVQNNAVLTAEKISKMTDNELTLEILKQSGFYMKRTNCRKPEHRALTADGWVKKGGSFVLSDSDIERLRAAKPADGKPVKLHMDLLISPDPYVEEKKDAEPEKEQGSKDGDERKDDSGKDDGSGNKDDGSGGGDDGSGKDDGSGSGDDGSGKDDGSGSSDQKPADDPSGDEDGKKDADGKDKDGSGSEDKKADNKSRRVYSTYKLLSPELLFVAVASKADADAVEKICREPKVKDKGEKEPGAGKADKGDMLPEYRTISMTDRSGPPLEETLKDGTPVTLEWIEPDKHDDEDRKSALVYLKALACLTAAAAAVTIAAIRRKRKG